MVLLQPMMRIELSRRTMNCHWRQVFLQAVSPLAVPAAEHIDEREHLHDCGHRAGEVHRGPLSHRRDMTAAERQRGQGYVCVADKWARARVGMCRPERRPGLGSDPRGSRGRKNSSRQIVIFHRFRLYVGGWGKNYRVRQRSCYPLLSSIISSVIVIWK